MLISVVGTGQNQLLPGKESKGDAAVLLHCSLVRNMWPKPTGVLEHYCEGKPIWQFSLFRGVSFWSHPQGDEGYQSIFLFQNSNSCKWYQRISGTFWSYHVRAPWGDTTTGKYVLENFWRENFSEISRRVLGPTMRLIQWILSKLFLGSKRPRREADHSA